MKQITTKEIDQLANKALSLGNPYIARAVRYYVDMIPVYLYAGEKMSRQEIDLAYLETAAKDIRAGFNDRSVGYYDKWYRYNHADGGRAYDLGQRLAADRPGCPDEFQIIPCMN